MSPFRASLDHPTLYFVLAYPLTLSLCLSRIVDKATNTLLVVTIQNWIQIGLPPPSVRGTLSADFVKQ